MTCAVEQTLLCLEDTDVVDETTSTDWAGNHNDDKGAARNTCRRAFHCRTLLTDDRVLANLLATENNNRPSADCFCRQTEVLPYMRDTVVTWMLEVRNRFYLSTLAVNPAITPNHVQQILKTRASNYHSY